MTRETFDLRVEWIRSNQETHLDVLQASIDILLPLARKEYDDSLSTYHARVVERERKGVAAREKAKELNEGKQNGETPEVQVQLAALPAEVPDLAESELIQSSLLSCPERGEGIENTTEARTDLVRLASHTVPEPKKKITFSDTMRTALYHVLMLEDEIVQITGEKLLS